MTAFLCVMLLLMGGMILRVAYIGSGGMEVEAAAFQSQRTVQLAETRAGIFDRNFNLLVNKSEERRILVFPDILDIPSLISFTDREELAAVFQKNEPSVMDIGGKIIEGAGIYNFSFPKRYGEKPLAVHAVGYVNTGKGVSGTEKGFDGFLRENSERVTVTYHTDGTGKLLSGEEINLFSEENNENCGVVLTLESDIQKITEKALFEGTEKGAAVVMDIENGEILATASVPVFDPSDIAASLEAKNSPFINRAFSAYSVGSTWKIIVAAAALESGIDVSETYNCTGSIIVDDRIYKCHWAAGHGEIDMEKALEISCNPYFIALAQKIGGEKILDTAKNIGFGVPSSFGEGFSSAAGKLPDEDELSAKTVLASFSFGQGSLLATPLQMAVLASAASNGGFAVTPKLVLGTVDREGDFEKTPEYAANPVFSKKTAEKIKEMMISVVENGSGENAKPKKGSAGGKTASAQTGQYDPEGNEIIHAWFVGFYPAEKPEYAIAVFAEGMNSGGDFAAPIFKNICDGIELINCN